MDAVITRAEGGLGAGRAGPPGAAPTYRAASDPSSRPLVAPSAGAYHGPARRLLWMFTLHSASPLRTRTARTLLSLVVSAAPVSLAAQPGAYQAQNLPGSVGFNVPPDDVLSQEVLDVDARADNSAAALPPPIGTPIPEPATIALVAGGLFAVGVIVRRRRRA